MESGVVSEKMATVLTVPLDFAEDFHKFLSAQKILEPRLKPKVENELLFLPLIDGCDLGEFAEKLDQIGQWGMDFSKLRIGPPPIDPHKRLAKEVETWLDDEGIDLELIDAMLEQLPKKWEMLGDLALLPSDSFNNEDWQFILDASLREQQLWQAIANALKVNRIGRQNPVKDDITRTSQAELLLGDSGWVEFQDHGVRFGFDMSEVMFSSGNITERRRMGNFDMTGEVVVDCYAGIGYYTQHMLKRGNAKLVHACEINPNSIRALKWSAQANEVSERLVVHAGDNQETLPGLAGIADRCNLGLLPSSEPVWELALNCLKPEGGILHVHMNVEEEKIPDFLDYTLGEFRRLAKENGRVCEVEMQHVEKVKWFAPRVRHIVMDVSIKAI